MRRGPRDKGGKARTGSGILRVKRGFNPNSSSLGFDVTFLLASVGGLSLFSAVVSAILRVRKPKRHGQGPPPDAVDPVDPLDAADG